MFRPCDMLLKFYKSPAEMLKDLAYFYFNIFSSHTSARQILFYVTAKKQKTSSNQAVRKVPHNGKLKAI
eukprot:gene962-559_t